jgi:hypothetical protein
MKINLSKYFHTKNTFTLMGMTALVVFAALSFDNLKGFAEYIILNYKQSVLYTSVVCFAIGCTHALTKRTNQENVFFFKFLGNPFIASIFTATTYGVMINACLALFYIIIYENDLMIKYPGIDKITTGSAIILLLVGSIYGICKMLIEICRPIQSESVTERKEA